MRSIFVVALLLSFPAFAAAQSLNGSLAGTGSFSVSVSPQYPAPLSDMTLSLTSATLPLQAASMTIFVDGSTFYRGNVQPVTIPVGTAGTILSVKVVVSVGGATYTKTILVQPQDITLIAEPLSSAPPLYLGKPLIPIGGATRVVAIANIRDAGGKIIPPQALSYTWTVDTTELDASSGPGRDSLLVASPLEYRDRTVSVRVQSPDGTLSGGATLTLTPSEPTVRIYENDPLLGIRFDKALSGLFAMQGAESSFYGAVFSAPEEGTASTSSAWLINGSPAQNGNLLTLRTSGTGQGNASLSFRVAFGIGLQTQISIPLSFGSSPSSSLLGL